MTEKLIIGGVEIKCPRWKKIEKLTIWGNDYSGLERE